MLFMLKIRSVTIAPPSRAPKSKPMKVTTGIIELRKACSPTARRRERPLAMAVHIVGAQVLDEIGAGQAGDIRDGQRPRSTNAGMSNS